MSHTRNNNEEHSYSVFELNSTVRSLLERQYGGIWVEAEVIEATQARSGHVYYTLSDPDGKAQMRAVMWRGQAMRYGKMIKTGAQLRCQGRLTLYEARGSYQFVTERLEEAGAGLRAKKLAALKSKFQAEGLFDAERKRLLPPLPNCIGIVTSRDGAALQDILKILKRRFPVRVILAHAAVQGADAPAEITAAIDKLCAVSDIDVVIVGRGGGSAEDLDAFNAEMVVRAIARHPKPVVSAVGHEIDISLTDLVADKRAATPSEAAELVVPEIEALAQQVLDLRSSIVNSMAHRLVAHKEQTAVLEKRLHLKDPRKRLRDAIESLSRSREALNRWPVLYLSQSRNKLTNVSHKLAYWPRPVLAQNNERLSRATVPLLRWPEPSMERNKGKLTALIAELDALSPLASFTRGYAMVRRRPDDAVVRHAQEAPAGTIIDVTLARGALVCSVTESIEGENTNAQSRSNRRSR